MILGLDIYLLEPYIVYCMKLPNGFFKKTLMDGSEIYFYGDIYNINMPQFKQFVKFTHKIILFTDEISYGIHNYKPIKGDLKNQILDRTSPFAHSHLNILHNSLINSDYYYNFQLTSGHGSKPINKFSILTDNNIINSGLSQDASNHFYILEKSYVDKITNKKLSNDQIQNYLNNEKSKKNIKDHLFNNFSKNKITKK